MIKKILSKFLTVILIVSTLICVVVVFKTATKQEPYLFGMRFFYIVSGSMEPTIHTGSAVVVKKDKDGVYDVGDIITFSSDQAEIYGSPNTHRIISVVEDSGRRLYQTQGDANPVPDPNLVLPEHIYGRVIMTTGDAKWLGTFIGLVTTPMGFVTVIILPIMLIFLLLIKDFIRDFNEETRKRALEEIEQEKAAKAEEAQTQPEPVAEEKPEPVAEEKSEPQAEEGGSKS